MSSSKPTPAGASASKKIRMTMACERCRSKKVKCDFAHPQCARCQQAKVQCSYDGSATQIDLFNLVKLNETVDILQKRVQSIETDIKDVCSNTQYVADEVRMNRAAGNFSEQESDTEQQQQQQQQYRQRRQESGGGMSLQPSPRPGPRRINGLLPASSSRWSLSLTPSGLRIDTNILSLHDLYDILLSGVSQFELTNGGGGACCSGTHETGPLDTSSQSSGSSIAGESPRPESATVLRKKPLWKTRLKTFPLYSTWEPEHNDTPAYGRDQKRSYATYEQEIPNRVKPEPAEPFSRETLDSLIDVFCECFLCLLDPEPSTSIATRFRQGTLDPLLANAVFAWTARHAAIYHDAFPGKDPNQVGHAYFLKAKELVKNRFMKTSIDTMHSLLIMYIYAIGIPSEHKAEVESEAYIYLGLGIRMCLDLKMNAESTSTDVYDKERHRRFFWVFYFLETLGSIYSDKPFSLPPDDMITVGFPTLMEHEQQGEVRYRQEFILQRYKITRIYRNIINKTAEEKPLLSHISAVGKELEEWRAALPSYLRYEPGDIHRRQWDWTSFREQACVKLNLEYNFELCQLYGMFFSKTAGEDGSQPSTIEVLSRDICLKAARNTIELLECWSQLKQRWCHFSLENLMMATIIYGNILSLPNDDEREFAKQSLEKMAKMLLNSPVRHHKYVLALVNKIKIILKEATGADMALDGEPLQLEPTGSEEEEGKESQKSNAKQKKPVTSQPTATEVPLQQQQQQQMQPLAPQQQQQPQSQNSMPPNLPPQNVQPISLTTQFIPRNPIYSMLDVSSDTSVFDVSKTQPFAEDMHFSDFVYNPTLMDFSNTVSNPTILPPAMVPSNSRDGFSQGKKPDYVAPAASAPPDNQYGQPSFGNYGFNANGSNNDSSGSSSNRNTSNSNNSNKSTPTAASTSSVHTHSPTAPMANLPFGQQPHQHQRTSSLSPPVWMKAPSSQPVMLSNPADDPSYLRMTPDNYDYRQYQPTPPPQHQQPPSQQPPSTTDSSSSMKNYYNAPNYNGSYY